MVLAMRPEVRQALAGTGLPPSFLQDFAKAQEAQYAAIFQRDGSTPIASWLQPDQTKRAAAPVPARIPVLDAGGGLLGYVELASPMPIDVQAKVTTNKSDNSKYQQDKSNKRQAKNNNTEVMILI